MQTLEKIHYSAMNNAKWCDALCRAHNSPGEFHSAYWLNQGKLPPYISRLVTLGGSEQQAEQLEAIRALALDPGAQFSVKDSYKCLDLAALGFSVLFEATWIHWPVGTALPRDSAEQLTWSVVRTDFELAEWERAWRGNSANAEADEAEPVFVPSLLREPGLHFLAGKKDGVALASAVLNRTGDVVGLSNVFSAMSGVGALFPGCVRLAQELYPQLSIVGYERGDALVTAENAGFERVHGLTVWQRA